MGDVRDISIRTLYQTSCKLSIVMFVFVQLKMQQKMHQYRQLLTTVFSFGFNLLSFDHYRPQTKFGARKYVYRRLSVNRGEYLTWYTPRGQVHLLGADTPQSRHPVGADTLPPGADTLPPGADTPPCRACWEIRSTRGRYASYWNAILYLNCGFKNAFGSISFPCSCTEFNIWDFSIFD